jgi:hypothetical protein
MSAHEQAVRRFRRRLAAVLSVKQTLSLATAWLFLWGTVVLALRAALGTERLPLLWGLAGLVPCGAVALVTTRRRLPGLTVIRALVDQQSHSGGLVMAGAECSLGRWQQMLPEPRVPDLRWHGRRAVLMLAAAAGFVLAAFLVPQRLAELGSGPRLEVGKEVGKLAEQIEILKEEKIVEPGRAQDLEKQLDRVRQEARGRDPARTLEALDHLESQTKKSAHEAAEAAGRQAEKLAQAQSLAEALRQAGDQLDPKLKAEVMAELTARAQKAAAEGDLAELDPALAEALQKGSLDAKELQKLSEALKEGKEGKGKRLERLARAGLLDPEALQKLERASECKGEALAEYLKDCRGGT